MTRAEVLANFQVIKDQIEHFGEVFFDESDIPMIDAVIELLKGDYDLCDQGEERMVDHFCNIIGSYLDRHPDKTITSHVHIVDCKWKHEVRIVDKKAQVK